MHENMIDTLRYADHLKEAGVDSRQAEAMSRALNDELTDNVVTKSGLRASVDPRFDAVNATFHAIDARFDRVDARFDAMETRLDAVETRLDAVETRLDAMDFKLEALSDTVHNTAKYTFLVLGLVVALGLYNAVAPHFPTGDTTPATASHQQQASGNENHPISAGAEAAQPTDG